MKLIEDVHEETMIFLEFTNKTQNFISSILHSALKQYDNRNANYITANLSIISRMNDCVDSVKALVAINQMRDASILLLNLIELRLDLEYMTKNIEKVDDWISHDKLHEKPWKVFKLFRLLYKSAELDAEKDIYKQFSMIKHGNPVSGTFGFPIAVKENKLLITGENYGEKLGTTILMAAIQELLRVSKLYCIKLSEIGLEMQVLIDEYENLKTDFDKLNNSMMLWNLGLIIQKKNK